jgi:chemotaxis family two-component system sensor kinase Cph1
VQRAIRPEPSADDYRSSLTSTAKSPDRGIPLGLRDEPVGRRPHRVFWETPKDFRERVGFLDVGLERGDFCVIFGHADANRRVREVLAERGYDVSRLQNQGTLAIVDGQTTAAKLLSTIDDVFSEALERGATLIRLLGNIGWTHAGWPDEADLLKFEARVTTAAKRFPCVVVCMYDVGAVSGRVMLRGAFETHPMTFFRNLLRRNTHFVDVDEFLAGGVDAPE